MSQHTHALYCQLTTVPLRYVELYHARGWFDWAKQYTESDLRSVVRYLKRQYSKNPQMLTNMLRFRHLIVNLDYFGEYLAEARRLEALRRTDRESVLAATGRPTRADKPAQPAAVHVAKLLAKMREAAR